MSTPHPMKRRILFVDGPEHELRDIDSQLASRTPAWEFPCASTGQAALEQLRAQPFDAIVTDLHLDDMPGLQLATETLATFPNVHRLLLADLGDPPSLFRCVGGAHQFLAKPCEPDRLLAVLERAFAFQVWLPNQTVRALVGQLPNLPSPADLYQTVVHELRVDPPSIERVAALVATDPAMAAKLLQLANSAAYGPPLDEADPVAATRELGLTNTQGALLLGHSYSDFAELDHAGFSIQDLWNHARRTSLYARRVAEAQNASQRQMLQAATAGLLHNLGTVALAVNLPERFAQSELLRRTRNLTAWEAEHQVFGASHPEVAASLLALWNLPPAIIEAVAMHHLPTRFLTQSFSPLTAVHVANAFAHAESLESAQPRLDLQYLAQLGLQQRLPEWWIHCHADHSSAPNPVTPMPPASTPSHG
jgi:HD-like signal output (HDOD) protein/CheY-like chemotaxis protein